MKMFFIVVIFIATVFSGGGYLAGIERGEINTTIKAYEKLTECAQGGDTATFSVEVDADGRLSRYECITGVRQNYSYQHYWLTKGLNVPVTLTLSPVAVANSNSTAVVR